MCGLVVIKITCLDSEHIQDLLVDCDGVQDPLPPSRTVRERTMHAC